jgi:hypothetical protein
MEQPLRKRQTKHSTFLLRFEGDGTMFRGSMSQPVAVSTLERDLHTHERGLAKMGAPTSAMRIRMKARAWAWLIVFAATPASACPICDTETGVAVRTGIVENFSTHFLATIAPFPVLIAAVALLHWGAPRRPRS